MRRLFASIVVILLHGSGAACKTARSQTGLSEVRQSTLLDSASEKIAYHLIAKAHDDMEVVGKSDNKLWPHLQIFYVRIRTQDPTVYLVKDNYWENFRDFWSHALGGRPEHSLEIALVSSSEWEVGHKIKELIICERTAKNPKIEKAANADKRRIFEDKWEPTLGRSVDWNGNETDGPFAYACPKWRGLGQNMDEELQEYEDTEEKYNYPY